MTRDDVQRWLDGYVAAWRDVRPRGDRRAVQPGCDLSIPPVRRAGDRPRRDRGGLAGIARRRRDMGREVRAVRRRWGSSGRDRREPVSEPGRLASAPCTTTCGRCDSTRTAAAWTSSSTTTSCRSACARITEDGCGRVRHRPRRSCYARGHEGALRDPRDRHAPGRARDRDDADRVERPARGAAGATDIRAVMSRARWMVRLRHP